MEINFDKVFGGACIAALVGVFSFIGILAVQDGQVDQKGAEASLAKLGYTQVQPAQYTYGLCPKGYNIRTAFTAVSSTNEPVSGAVCRSEGFLIATKAPVVVTRT